MRAASPLLDRFYRYVSPEPNSGCWLWTGFVSHSGYGQLGVGSMKDSTRRIAVAHRVAHELFKGPIADGLEVDHLCRVRSCVNPEHLEAVTPSINVRRSTAPAVNSRLGVMRRGELSPRSKLRKADVCRIKEMRNGGASLSTIGKVFTISKTHVSNIVRGRLWNN
jgi:hypothetical protein